MLIILFLVLLLSPILQNLFQRWPVGRIRNLNPSAGGAQVPHHPRIFLLPGKPAKRLGRLQRLQPRRPHALAPPALRQPAPKTNPPMTAFNTPPLIAAQAHLPSRCILTIVKKCHFPPPCSILLPHPHPTSPYDRPFDRPFRVGHLPLKGAVRTFGGPA